MMGQRRARGTRARSPLGRTTGRTAGGSARPDGGWPALRGAMARPPARGTNAKRPAFYLWRGVRTRARVAPGETTVAARNEPVRERIRRKLESAMEHMDEDFERVEFWAAALDAFTQPVPDYEPPHEFMLGQNGAANGAGKPSARSAARR